MPYEVKVTVTNNGGTIKRIVESEEKLNSFLANISTNGIKWESNGVVDVIPFHSIQKIQYYEI